MNVDELKAGRELDEIIAGIMGHEPRIMWMATTDGGKSYFYQSDRKHEVEEHLADIKKNYPEGWAAKGELMPWKIYSRYSEDIAAAWEVFIKISMPVYIHRAYEKIHGVGPIGYQLNWCNDENCPCQLLTEGSGCPLGNEVWAETAPLAICKAAFKTLEATT